MVYFFVYRLYIYILFFLYFCLQVAVHIEPYKERNAGNMFTNVKYIIER